MLRELQELAWVEELLCAVGAAVGPTDVLRRIVPLAHAEAATDPREHGAPSISDVAETLLPFVEEARLRGVKHIVFLSVAGAETNRLVPHYAVEE